MTSPLTPAQIEEAIANGDLPADSSRPVAYLEVAITEVPDGFYTRAYLWDGNTPPRNLRASITLAEREPLAVALALLAHRTERTANLLRTFSSATSLVILPPTNSIESST